MPLSIRLGGSGVSLTLREWVNSGLMTFFFLIIGLEARREFDMGELRERRRVALRLAAGIGGMIVPVAIYLALNAGHPSAHGWGVAMSTDTAFALGLLALVGRRLPDSVRAFLLTVVVVDDVVALAVIATVYSGHVALGPLLIALAIFGVLLLVRAGRIRHGVIYALLGTAAWGAVLFSGVDPVTVGLVMGLLTYAYPPAREDLERATGLFRLFREQPTPELARSASTGLTAALSPNERLVQLYHPWTSYLIVPLFALANAGIAISALVTMVEYGDFECPYCGQAEPVIRELLADYGDVRYVWRHLPLTDVHQRAQLAAEAAEAAASQDAFWPMHDLLMGQTRSSTGGLGLSTTQWTRRDYACRPVASRNSTVTGSRAAIAATWLVNFC